MESLTSAELAEVERLANGWESGHGVLVLRAVAEVKRLQRQKEQLRAAIYDVLNAWGGPRESGTPCAWDVLARAAEETA